MLLIVPLFIGTTELILIAAIALLLFGGKKLPKLMKGLGQGMLSFKKGLNESLKEEEAITSEQASQTANSSNDTEE